MLQRRAIAKWLSTHGAFGGFGAVAAGVGLPASTANAQAQAAAASAKPASAAASTTQKPAVPPPVQVAALSGAAVMVRDGQTAQLKLGSQLRQGDRIETQDNAELLLRFADGAQSVVRRDSQLEIGTLKLSGPAAERSKVIAIVKGGLRYLSGTISKNKGSVRFNTATATIGIRGTDIEIAINVNASETLAAGTILKVNSGTANLSATDGTDVDVRAGEWALGSEPELTPRGSGKRRPAARALAGAAQQAASQLLGNSKLDALLGNR